jgi:co-chaperonin GroES (HSP10)
VWTGKNESGASPIGDYVLVMPDLAADKSSGGVFIDPVTVDRHTLASETGIIVALGDQAFAWNADRSRRWEGEKPEPGQRVYYTRYAGQVVHGDDGRTYRCMEDKCIGAVMK